MTPGNKLLPTCYRAKFGHSGSNDTSVIMEKIDPSRPAFQCHSRSLELTRIDRWLTAITYP